MKFAEIRASSDPLFPVYGQNSIRIFPYLRYDSAHIREDTDQRKRAFRHISRGERTEVGCYLIRRV